MISVNIRSFICLKSMKYFSGVISSLQGLSKTFTELMCHIHICMERERERETERDRQKEREGK